MDLGKSNFATSHAAKPRRRPQARSSITAATWFYRETRAERRTQIRPSSTDYLGMTAEIRRFCECKRSRKDTLRVAGDERVRIQSRARPEYRPQELRSSNCSRLYGTVRYRSALSSEMKTITKWRIQQSRRAPATM